MSFAELLCIATTVIICVVGVCGDSSDTMQLVSTSQRLAGQHVCA